MPATEFLPPALSSELMNMMVQRLSLPASVALGVRRDAIFAALSSPAPSYTRRLSLEGAR